MTTPLDKIKTLDFLCEDSFTESYYAFDTIKKINCVLIFPKKPTSWTYDIQYI